VINGKVLSNGKILVPTLQWYISHSCNLTCNNCSNFNNFALGGNDKFVRFEQEANAWSQKLHVNDFCIIGGEPFVNYDLDSWVHGLRDRFDCKDFRVVTNGTLLAKHADKFKSWFDRGVTIELSFHSMAHVKRAFDIIDDVLDGKYEKYQITKRNFIKDQPRHIGCEYDEAILLGNHPAFIINYKTRFIKWGPSTFKEGVWHFHKSKANKAHANCWHKDTPYIFKGKMYKCGTVVGAQEFVKKYSVRPQDKELYESYRPIDPMSNNLEVQIQNLNNSIPQCSLCPSKSEEYEDIVLDKKKILP